MFLAMFFVLTFVGTKIGHITFIVVYISTQLRYKANMGMFLNIMSKKQKPKINLIAEFKGLYGDRNALPDTDYLVSELIETRSSKFNWDIKPHIHPALLQVFFIEQGSFAFIDNNEKKELQGPCLIIIPATLLHGFVFNKNIVGRIVSVTELYYTTIATELQNVVQQTKQIMCITAFSMHHSAAQVKNLFGQITDELQAQQLGKKMMLKAYLQQLILIVNRLKVNAGQQQAGQSSHAVAYYQKFQQLVKQSGGNTTITKLAADMGISAVHLNRICRAVAGKPANALLNDHLVVEAKKHLAYTNYSIAQIAYLLKFEYPNYFARFFKKHTGVSPSAFRAGLK